MSKFVFKVSYNGDERLTDNHDNTIVEADNENCRVIIHGFVFTRKEIKEVVARLRNWISNDTMQIDGDSPNMLTGDSK